MRLLLLLLVLSVPCLVSAQTTWKGLQFGQTREQVREHLLAQNIQTESSQEGSLQSTTDYELFLPSLQYTLPLQLSFHFTDSGGLMDVALTLDLPAMRRHWASLGADDALLHFAGTRLAAALAGRYGTPLYQSANCEADNKQTTASCIIIWRGPEQITELERLPTARGPRLLVRYQMLATDL